MKFFPGMLLIFLVFSSNISAQRLSRQQVQDTISKIPAFSMYKDNFFITGVPLNTEISKETADAKYQISFRQLITRKPLPLDSYLFLSYTQKAFWKIYDFSSPFEEIIFNPGIHLLKPIFDKEDKIIGTAFLKVEHQSNGRDSIYSRSWNNVSLSFHGRILQKTTVAVEAWIPFGNKEDNPDLMDYLGYGEVNILQDFQQNKIEAELMLRKGSEKGALRLRFFYRPFKIENLFFMTEWFNGYGEELISYDSFTNMVRVGFVLRSHELNFIRSTPGSMSQ